MSPLLRSMLIIAFTLILIPYSSRAQDARPRAAQGELTYPPTLPNGQAIVTDRSPDFLKPSATLKADVAIAKTAPTIDFLYFPHQTYPGQPWANWGDSLAVNGRYYASIGDHLAIGAKGDGSNGTGNAFVFEYDPAARSIRRLVDLAAVLNLPAGHYTPGKVHGRLDLGSDGWLYFATHRGAEKSTIDRYHYKGDWILRANPSTGATEVVAHGPVPKHSIPASVLDPQRLIFYGATAAGPDSPDQRIQFFAYDLNARKLLYSGPDGPARAMMFARSTGRVYYVPGADEGQLMRYDPAHPAAAPAKVEGTVIGIRAATEETPQGFIYTVSLGQRSADADLWSFDTRTEKAAKLGSASVGTQAYVATLDADPTGRCLYYVPGAHGSSERDGSPVVQFDVQTRRKKVIAFLHPFFQQNYGVTPKGTYGLAVDPAGDKLYITWNVSRGSRAWDCCALTVIHIPESERPPRNALPSSSSAPRQP